ncbi:putative pentatricopeptide repeat-containing protein [Iris pallida]|uniref:Pentatricopeptide repeat-containing protein n=1 Tax=Iris pallida TaxID=29817 RepID=A0AAX6GRD5_IRIPA|nr:putative pentatricopeptide repeat-containing protein [Iris pallida]
MLASSSQTPNEATLVPVIVACGAAAALAEGVWAHCYVLRNGLQANRFLRTALVDMYSRCGRLDLAESVFDGSTSAAAADTTSYNAMIRAYGTHGRGTSAVRLFDRMGAEGVRVDAATLVVVMSACAHAGLVDRGREIFDGMERRFGIWPGDEHYGCLVDLLGRAGRLEEAEKVVREMPVKPSAIVYRSLLGACRRHNDSEMGERMIADLLRLEPEHGGNYVLQSNMYADANRWNDVGRVRKAMKEKGIDKTPGLSLVELDGALHEFVMGDRTHPCSKEIYAMLDEMGRRLHEAGYRPKTKGVLFDMEEEDKEDALSYHNERLAIAFALVASDSSAPIRITKNLRVCADCHSTIKLISSIYQREILMRDRSRFHHFKNGACSCSDYWLSRTLLSTMMLGNGHENRH